MSADLLFWLTCGGLVATCLAAIGARSLGEFAPHELKEICRRKKRPGRLGEILKRREDVELAADSLLFTLASLTLIAGACLLCEETLTPGRFVLAVVAGAAALMAATIWIPWAVARLWAAGFLYRTWPLWRATAVVLTPLVLIARFIDALTRRLAGRPEEPQDEESFEEDITVPNDLDVESLKYLQGKKLSALLSAEKRATEYALIGSKRPNFTIRFPKLDTQAVGQFIQLWEITTAYAGLMLNIDTYNQPAVETGKKATFGLMGRAGFEEWKTKVDAKLTPTEHIV